MTPGDFPSVRPLRENEEATNLDTASVRDASITGMQWIDAHQHTHTLSWNDQHKLGLGGCRAAVSIAYNPHWTPYRPVRSEDVRYQWDLAVKWTRYLDAKHPFDTYVAIGIHTNARVADVEDLYGVMPDYCQHEKVLAIGETGIEPVQYDSRWPIVEQEPVVREQMRIAESQQLPFILHTPTVKTGEAAGAKGWGGLGLSEPDPSIEYSRAKIEATSIAVDLKEEAGLSDRRLIIDHADPTIIEFVMDSTDCYLGFSVKSPLKGVTSADIADAINTYGPDRIIVNSDVIGYLDCDFFCIPRTIHDLHTMGISKDDIRTVFLENPAQILGLPM